MYILLTCKLVNINCKNYGQIKTPIFIKKSPNIEILKIIWQLIFVFRMKDQEKSEKSSKIMKSLEPKITKKSWKWDHQRSPNWVIFGDFWWLLVIFRDKIWRFTMINHDISWSIMTNHHPIGRGSHSTCTHPFQHFARAPLSLQHLAIARW